MDILISWKMQIGFTFRLHFVANGNGMNGVPIHSRCPFDDTDGNTIKNASHRRWSSHHCVYQTFRKFQLRTKGASRKYAILFALKMPEYVCVMYYGRWHLHCSIFHRKINKLINNGKTNKCARTWYMGHEHVAHTPCANLPHHFLIDWSRRLLYAFYFH